MNERMNGKPGRRELLHRIDMESFAVDKVKLYLGTHPDDAEALAFFKEHSRNRNQAMEEYARNYTPLTIDTASASCEDTWKWIQEPWPWQEGGC